MQLLTRIISAEDIHSILARTGVNAFVGNLIDRLENGFRELGEKQANIPPRTGLHYRNPDLGLLEWMPASVNEGTATLKIVGYHPTNPLQRDLPTILSSIGIFDTTTGHMRAILDGTLPTAIRTGAMTAVASCAMHSDSRPITLGIVGCGAQAVTQTHALSLLFDIEKLIVFDIDSSSAQTLASRLHFIDSPVEIVDASELSDLLESSDILCTCTSADPGSGPLFKDFCNRPELHVNAVGSDFPDKIELPIEFLGRSFVVPDFYEQARAEGECQQLQESQIACDLSELLKDDAKQQSAKATLSVFDSTGHAYADYITSLVFFERAVELGLGREIELESVPADPKNPYGALAEKSFQEYSSRKTGSIPA